jgi:hypothetical protein
VRTLGRPSLRRLHRSPVRIDPAGARALVAGGALLIDVRRRDDRSTPLDGALRIEPDMLPEHVAGFDRALPIVLACT